jgi:Zn-dependent protease
VDLGLVFVMLPILLFSVIVHECAHGYVALWNGDPTARDAGRLTLNPIPHLDLFGSILLPAMLVLSGSRFLFAWAKPVPVQVHNLHNPPTDSIKVAAAGPISNLMLGFVFALVISIAYRITPDPPSLLITFGIFGIYLNCLLAVFNLLPIPPLDGHWVLLRFLPPGAAMAFQRIGFLGIILIFMIFMIPGVRYVLLTLPIGFLFKTLGTLAFIPPDVLNGILYSLGLG